MMALKRFLGILSVLAVWAGCGDGQQADVSGVVDPYCEQMVTCQWYGNFEVCQQAAHSVTAALIHVYGQNCGNAWLDVMDCETFIACDDFEGCDPEYELAQDVCI